MVALVMDRPQNHGKGHSEDVIKEEVKERIEEED
jgi:hypothetical protein